MAFIGQSIYQKQSKILQMLKDSNLNNDFIADVKSILMSISKDIDDLTKSNAKITNKQQEASFFCDWYIENYGEPPTYKQAAKHLGISETAAYERFRHIRYKMKTYPVKQTKND